MKVLSMWYQPIAEVEFTWLEVTRLILYSEQHYDHKCIELSKEGGTLYGMRNMFVTKGKDAKIVYRLDEHTAGLLAKCAERNDPAMLQKMVGVSREISNAWRKINAENLK